MNHEYLCKRRAMPTPSEPQKMRTVKNSNNPKLQVASTSRDKKCTPSIPPPPSDVPVGLHDTVLPSYGSKKDSKGMKAFSFYVFRNISTLSFVLVWMLQTASLLRWGPHQTPQVQEIKADWQLQSSLMESSRSRSEQRQLRSKSRDGASQSNDFQPRVLFLEEVGESSFFHHRNSKPSRTVGAMSPTTLLLFHDETTSNFFESAICPSAITSTSAAGGNEDEAGQCLAIGTQRLPSISNCADIHSMGMFESVLDSTSSAADTRFVTRPLANGGTRTAWKLADTQDRADGGDESAFVVKTLKIDRHFDWLDLKMQHMDALALERLTKSEYVVNIYGYCGQTSITEYARKVGSKIFNDQSLVPEDKLRYAHDMAQSIADVHAVAAEGQVALIHKDISASNFVIVGDGGALKLNDFNAGQLQCWNDFQNRPCGFLSREEFGGEGLRRVDTRAPEELRRDSPLTEKIDVYGLGTALYYLLTDTRVYSVEPTTLDEEEKRQHILGGVLPTFPKDIEESTDPSIQAIRGMMHLALRSDAPRRPSAQDIARTLKKAVLIGEEESNKISPSLVFLAGLVRSTKEIHQSTWDRLVELNCKYGIGIHILADEASKLSDIENLRLQYNTVCAPFVIQQCHHETNKALFPNRIDRIAYLRDVQREHLRQNFEGRNLEISAVVVVDLDLKGFPSNKVILQEVLQLIQDPDEHDVICAAGQMWNPDGYYDTFSTVLLPKTFVFPIAGRLLRKFIDGEDQALVRSDDAFGSFTQWDLMEHFEREASNSVAGTVLVRSCFGGMAIYRASSWFMPECRYTADSKNMMDFANADDGRPCEHLVFHDCLMNTDPSILIAVKPSLKTFWNLPGEVTNRMKAGGNIPGGLNNNDGLATLGRDRDNGSKLVSGDYRARINGHGVLVVEQHSTLGEKCEERWQITPSPSIFNENWDNSFLILEKSGELVLLQQLRQDLNPELCESAILEIKMNPVNSTISPTATVCRVKVWSSGVEGPSAKHHYEVVLEEDGELRVEDLTSNQVLWSSRPSNIGTAFLEIIEAPCIPSGDESTINQALTLPGSKAVLCAGAEFSLSSPIVFTEDYQQVYTEGLPSGDQRALLRAVGASVVTAVSMKDRSHTVLRNVIVDGSRPILGHVVPSPSLFAGGGLIAAGGHNVTGQVIAGIKAYEPRSWSVVHVQEGDDSVLRGCENVLIENNHLGPAGHAVGTRNPVADGISLACKRSVVRNNTIIDTTDGGIVVFGSPGSLIEDNVIVARTRALLGGINMVDRAPYEGNYVNTVVRRNLIHAEGSTINVGLGMGMGIWTCQDMSATLESQELLYYGAMVTENVLKGDYMGYGFAVNGVRNWTVTGNLDLSTHRGTPMADCGGDLPSSPDGFQIVQHTSEGLFQDEFKDALLDSIAETFRDRIPKRTLTTTSLDRPVWLTPNTHPYESIKVTDSQHSNEPAIPTKTAVERSCIPSGDDRSINAVLTQPGSVAVLCSGSVFDLSNPIVFTKDKQKVYTEGLPAGDLRALLRVADPSVVTAVSMVDRSRSELRNVVIDGSRSLQGYVVPNPSLFNGGGLIAAGGTAVTGQVISGVHAYEPRSWTILHFQEGEEDRCENALVENNYFGPAGIGGGGMSFACRRSVVRNNTVVDVMDTGISIHGAPGSLIEDNTIVARTRSLVGGIAMVDMAPYNGDFTRTHVRRNLIHAEGGIIHFGLGMGSRIWACPDADEDDASSPDNSKAAVLVGATVTENVLKGEHMGYGFALNGVRHWTVTGNKDFSKHGGTPMVDCNGNGKLPSFPGGFQIVKETSEGVFQDEFREAVLDAIAGTFHVGG